MTNVAALDKIFKSVFWRDVPQINPDEPSFIGSVIKTSENRLQALLAYCLDPNAPNEVNSVFMDALVTCISEKANVFSQDTFCDNYEVLTEFTTNNNGRIDILIKTVGQFDAERCAIIIEMKLNSILHNNLEDYFDSIEDCRYENKVGIVLALNNVKRYISHNKFFFLPVQYYFQVVKNVFEKQYKELYKGDDHILFFFKDFFNYARKLERHFLNEDIDEQIKFLIENKEDISKLDYVLKNKESYSSFNHWYFVNKLHIDDVSTIIQFVRKSLHEFSQDWLKVSARKGQVRKEGKLYFYFNGNSPFRDVFRFCIDYSSYLAFEPIVQLKLELDTSADIKQLFGIDIATAIDVFKNSDFGVVNQANYYNKAQLLEISSHTYYNNSSVAKYYDLIYLNVFPIVSSIENFIIDYFISAYQDKIINFFMHNISDKYEKDDSELVDTLPEKLVIRKPSDSLFITINWVDMNVMTISIWTTSQTSRLMHDTKIEALVEKFKWDSHSVEEDNCVFKTGILGKDDVTEVFRNFSGYVELGNIVTDEIKVLEAIDSVNLIIKQIKRREYLE